MTKHFDKRHIITFTLVFMIILTVCFLYYHNMKHVTTAQEEQDVLFDSYKTALIYSYLPELQKSADDFYQDYLEISPTIAYYDTKIESLTIDHNLATINFIIAPYVGPHQYIGIDEVTMTVSYIEEPETVSFQHIKNYELPDHMLNLLKKPLPEPS